MLLRIAASNSPHCLNRRPTSTRAMIGFCEQAKLLSAAGAGEAVFDHITRPRCTGLDPRNLAIPACDAKTRGCNQLPYLVQQVKILIRLPESDSFCEQRTRLAHVQKHNADVKWRSIPIEN